MPKWVTSRVQHLESETVEISSCVIMLPAHCNFWPDFRTRIYYTFYAILASCELVEILLLQLANSSGFFKYRFWYLFYFCIPPWSYWGMILLFLFMFDWKQTIFRTFIKTRFFWCSKPIQKSLFAPLWPQFLYFHLWCHFFDSHSTIIDLSIFSTTILTLLQFRLRLYNYWHHYIGAAW